MLAVITGGTRGIGFAIANALLKEGFSVLVTARKISEEVEKMMADGVAIDFLAVDNSKEEDISHLHDYIVEKYNGEVDILVNNAGVAPKVRNDMLELTRESFNYVVDINLKGTFFVSQMVANLMRGKGKGRIVNISSLSSYTASVERAEYCIAKAGISMITKLFAARMAEYGVGAFEISPGIIRTDMTAKVTEKYTKLINEGITPIKRFGEPTDIANAVVAVAKGYLDFATGTVIHADGGFSVRRL